MFSDLTINYPFNYYKCSIIQEKKEVNTDGKVPPKRDKIISKGEKKAGNRQSGFWPLESSVIKIRITEES